MPNYKSLTRIRKMQCFLFCMDKHHFADSESNQKWQLVQLIENGTNFPNPIYYSNMRFPSLGEGRWEILLPGECGTHRRGADSLSHPGYFLACVPDGGLGELSTSVMESPGQKQRRFVCAHPLNLSHEYQTHALSRGDVRTKRMPKFH